MSRLHKKLILVFCLGVLLCGVGAGVAFTEFGALSYGGQQILGDPDIRTENFDVKFEVGEEERKVWCVRTNDLNIRVDNSVPENTVRFCVTYNADRIEPYAYWTEEEGVVFSWSWKPHEDEMALMMEAKDVVLQNLKEGKIVSVDTVDLEDVTVLVNAKSESDVRLMY